ncbi:MAG: TrapT dctQ-M fusion permease, dicarboxylate transport [Variovorax sp.]|nr:TrapT dctQ-M fusion permease, dicarboxylate transport [Variovorax sp.]
MAHDSIAMSAPLVADNMASRTAAMVVRCVELAAALLVATETVILFVGVVSRYFFHRPLEWSDELASILFLWLAMMGAVIAFARGAHMRMTALAAKTSPRRQAFLNVLSLVVAMAFLLIAAVPSAQYALHEADITSPALEISALWRAAGLPVGIGLMLFLGVLQLVRVDRTLLLKALGLVAVVAAAMVALQPALATLGNLNLVIFFVLIAGGAIFASVPIAFAFGIATFAYLALTTQLPLTVVVGRMDEGMSHIILLAVPLFVLLGQLMETTGIARAMLGFLVNILGHVRGGLQYVLVGAMYLVSGISGSKAADMAAVTPVLFPELAKRGTQPGELVAILAATGAQTETVPPSIVLITLGSVVGVSITSLFIGGMLPAVALGLTLCGVIWFRTRKEDLSTVVKPTSRVVWRSLFVAVPALALPVVIRTAVVEGMATATEVSTIGVAYAVLCGLLIYRCKFTWERTRAMLVETAALSGAILLIIGAATGMAWALTQSGFSADLAAAMKAIPGGAGAYLAVTVLTFIILGSVLEGIPAIVLLGPLLFPIARQLGIHDVHYAMVVILSMGVGLFAPPFGVGYYMACAIGRIDPSEGMRTIWLYLAALIVGLVFVAAIPWLSIGFLAK